MAGKKLRKLRKTNYPIQALSGALSGFAYCIGYPVWGVRIIFTGVILLAPLAISGWLVTLYILFSIFLPKWDKNPEDFDRVTGD